jgi:hypothetical protein
MSKIAGVVMELRHPPKISVQPRMTDGRKAGDALKRINSKSTARSAQASDWEDVT